jgi:uncharacterized protein YllA (UPF0747 family)
MTEPRVIAEPLGGSLLARAVSAGEPLPWYEPRPSDIAAWRARAGDVRRAASAEWLGALAPAFGPAGAALLEPVAAGGVVVTTGQQPGLFGGPLYTLYKAIAALELASALEADTGVPARAVFWAATDDADFAEASSVWVRFDGDGGARRITMTQKPSDRIPLADVPIEDLGAQLAMLRQAARSAPDLRPLDLAEKAYATGRTIGGAFVTLLRGLLEPLGIAVLDASHPALLAAEQPILARAMRHAFEVDSALNEREAALRVFGTTPQVAQVPGLSLVFARTGGGVKGRVPLSEAAAHADSADLSPNVLLRPVVERALLPTVAYVAGPGELAYFAQVSAVARALSLPTPLAVPRWSATILEPEVARLLARHGVGWRELADGQAVETRLARSRVPATVREAMTELRTRIDGEVEQFRTALAGHENVVDPRVIAGTGRTLGFRLDRLERRVVAAVKRSHGGVTREVAAMRGALFPTGTRQERALSFIPLLALYGESLLAELRASARRHAEALLRGQPVPADRE